MLSYKIQIPARCNDSSSTISEAGKTRFSPKDWHTLQARVHPAVMHSVEVDSTGSSTVWVLVRCWPECQPGQVPAFECRVSGFALAGCQWFQRRQHGWTIQCWEMKTNDVSLRSCHHGLEPGKHGEQLDRTAGSSRVLPRGEA